MIFKNFYGAIVKTSFLNLFNVCAFRELQRFKLKQTVARVVYI